MRRFLFTVFLVVACGTGAVAGPIEEAKAAHDRGDYALAMQLSLSLAEQGNARAQFYLGVMYWMGQGVPQDAQESVKWLRKAGEQGDAYAQDNLGHMYQYGVGVRQDYQESLKWYRLAAKQGVQQAQAPLGLMYYEGRGVPQDFVRAHMWFSVSAEASKLRDDVASQMTAAQIEKAQEMARRCQDTKFKECD